MFYKIKSAPLSVIAITAVFLSACSGMIPTKEKRKKEKKLASYEQILRIARATEKGNDLTTAKNMYGRANRMRPEALEPLDGIGRISNAIGHFNDASQAYNRMATLSPNDGAVAAAMANH